MLTKTPAAPAAKKRAVALSYDFPSSIGYWLVTAAHAYERAVADELEPHGITFRQAQVLGWLALDGNLTQAELAHRLRIEPPTLAGVLDRMERDGWIVRLACRDDRRKKRVGPTAAARPVWARIARAARQVRSRAVRGLSAAEVATLRALLERVRENLEADPRDRRQS